MFEKASRLKLRFDSVKGHLSVEDLWDLPLTSSTGKINLDDIAVALSDQLGTTATKSFVIKEKKANESLQLAFDIVVHIINTKVAEKEASDLLRANREKKQQIYELIAKKQNEALGEMSVDDLMKMVESL